MCPYYAQERHKLCHNSYSFSFLLSSPVAVLPLLKSVHATGHFKTFFNRSPEDKIQANTHWNVTVTTTTPNIFTISHYIAPLHTTIPHATLFPHSFPLLTLIVIFFHSLLPSPTQSITHPHLPHFHNLLQLVLPPPHPPLPLSPVVALFQITILFFFSPPDALVLVAITLPHFIFVILLKGCSGDSGQWASHLNGQRSWQSNRAHWRVPGPWNPLAGSVYVYKWISRQGEIIKPSKPNYHIGGKSACPWTISECWKAKCILVQSLRSW